MLENSYPLFVLAIGLTIVVGGIIVLRINAFLALITAAVAVSLLAPGAWGEKIPRVAEAFGKTAAGVGVVIALAAVIGVAMTRSGAADRIVRASLRAFGEKNTSTALAASSFVLAIPVFFDTVFYLLVPLARSTWRQTGRHYVRYLVAVASCISAHALIPPTPGPLVVAAELGVDLGVMIVVGAVVAAPATLAALAFGAWVDGRVHVEPCADEVVDHEGPAPIDGRHLPGLAESLTPVLLPVALIGARTTVDAVGDPAAGYGQFVAVLGNPNLALLLSAGIALTTYWRMRRPTTDQFSAAMEAALMSGGAIILITAAGGAFGAMLKSAELAGAVQSLFGRQAASGFGFLLLAFGVSALLKFAQGSSTAAMIVAAGMFSAMLETTELGYHPVYIATAIGSGSLVGSWMNDSGFWIFAKMGGLSELDTLRTWTPVLALIGVVAMATTLLLAAALPMT